MFAVCAMDTKLNRRRRAKGQLGARSSARPERPEPGAPPGTLVQRPDTGLSQGIVWSWNAAMCREIRFETVEEFSGIDLHPGAASVWIDVTGIPKPDTLAAIGRAFDLHPLSLEDVLSPGQRPKIEHFENYDFIVLKALALSPGVAESRVSIFLGREFVLTFEEGGTGAIEPVRERLRKARGHLRERGPDYLAYAVIDSVIDHYFPVMEELDDRLEAAEARVLEPGSRDLVGFAADVRRDLRTIRHAVWPLREVLASMIHDGGAFLVPDTQLYLRDSDDHVAQLQEMIEFSREITASLLEAYVSTVSLETNEVMRVLTLIATIFIPATFITGVYGMNFDTAASSLNMPELGWRWGYLFSLALMLATGVLFLGYFIRKGWIGSRRPARSSERESGLFED